jgi:hypothetical protein
MYESTLDSNDHRLGTIGHSQFVQRVADMRLDGSRRNFQAISSFVLPLHISPNTSNSRSVNSDLGAYRHIAADACETIEI